MKKVVSVRNNTSQREYTFALKPKFNCIGIKLKEKLKMI
jgi:hypothetical protein